MPNPELVGVKFKEHLAENGVHYCVATTNRSSLTYFSASIRAGHFYDPKDCQGLAHLLEHMVFLGSRRLPGNNEIADLIKKLGGSVNAWTAGEYSNFHFSCLPQHQDIAISAFLDCLAYPLLKKEDIVREIQSIDAEFEFKKRDDLRRLFQIQKETCNPAHPFSQFSVGNAEVFNQHSIASLQQKLRHFHRQRFFGAACRITVCSPEFSTASVDNLHQAIQLLPKHAPEALNWPQLYLPPQRKLQIQVKPIQHARRLIITFAISDCIPVISQALAYISHILGDEGDGSLLAYFKQQGWATNLIAGSGIEGKGFKDFNISIQLTELGETAIEDIVSALFFTISLIRRQREEWRWQEKVNLDRLARKYNDNPITIEQVCELTEAGWVQLKEPNDEQQMLTQALSHLSTDNLRIMHISPAVKTDNKSQYYEADYATKVIEPKALELWQNPPTISAIVLPEQNPYLGIRPKLRERKAEWALPQVVVKDRFKTIWFSQEQRFNSVKGDIYVSFDCPGFASNLQQATIKRVWLSAVNEYLQHAFYRAEIAGLHYRLYGHQAGFTLHCSGFSSTLQALTKNILDAIFSFSMYSNNFTTARDSQWHHLHNALLNKPINRLFMRLGVIVQQFSYAPKEMLQSLQNISFEDYKSTVATALDNCYVESLLHGNWQQTDAQNWVQQLDSYRQRYTTSPLPRSVVRMPPGQTHLHQVTCEHDDAAVVLYLQAPSSGIIDTVVCMILEQLLAGPFFNALRTEQQLGYIVGSGYVPHNQHPGIAFYVQSPTHDCQQLRHAMIEFLREQINQINYYRSYWPNIQHSLFKQLSEPDLSLAMQSQRYWLNLGLQDAKCERLDQLTNAVSNMQFADIYHYAEKLLKRDTFGELLLFSPGKLGGINHNHGKLIDNISLFKENARFFS